MDEEENDMKKYRSTPRHSMWLSTMQDRFRIATLTVLGFYLRTKSLGSQFIAEAELETTQQINWYMQGKFFIGKFPPLSTLIGSFVSRIAGYYGNEDLVYDGQ
jgi:hypothetical protein